MKPLAKREGTPKLFVRRVTARGRDGVGGRVGGRAPRSIMATDEDVWSVARKFSVQCTRPHKSHDQGY